MRRLVMTLLLTATAALAAPNVVVASLTAEAQGDTTRPVKLTVLLENKGDAPSEPGQVIVTLTPKVPPAQRGDGQTMFDPLQVGGPVPALQPNQKLPVTLETPYQCRNTMRGQRGTFRVSNIDPTGGDVVVSMAAVFRPGPSAPRR